MRKIDADELMARLEKKKSSWNNQKFTQGFNDAIMRVRSMVHAAKTIEDPKAKRLKIYDNPYTGKLMTTCSRCDGKVGPKDAFCKHCGAMFVDN